MKLSNHHAQPVQKLSNHRSLISILKQITYWSSLLLFLSLGAASANANDQRELRQAQKALSAGNYDKAFDQYKKKSEHNPLAQFSLALFYDYGWGRPIDRAKACHWYEKAAQGDIPAAAHFLGVCLAKGVHRDADGKQAVHWFQVAADLGHHYSLCDMAELYMQGNGVTKDPAKALSLCQQAAEQGVVRAMTRMGLFYLEGDKTIQDPGSASRWFEMAAQRNAPEAQYYLGTMMQDGIGQPKQPIKARFWFEQAASQGYVRAYYPTAELYFKAPADPQTDMWSEQDLAKAYLWLTTTLQSSQNSKEKQQVAAMLVQVLEVMPETWRPNLDTTVAEHLKAHPNQTN